MNKKKKNEKLKKKRQRILAKKGNSNNIEKAKKMDIEVEKELIKEKEKPENDKKAIKDFFNELVLKIKPFFKNLLHIIKLHFNLILFIFVVGLTLVNVTSHIVGSKVTKDYNDYSSYQLKYNKVLEKSGTYYVYLYSEDCSHCHDLKRYIFQYIDSEKSSKDNGIPLYIFCIDKHLDKLAATEETQENVLGVTDIEDLKIYGTPMLLLVSDGTVQTSFASTSTIKEQLGK